MPNLDDDLDNGADAQDGAETFDETHRDALDAGDVDLEDAPDIADNVFDATSALGDADDEGLLDAIDAADFEDGDDDFDADEDEDGDLDDGFEDEPDDSDLDDQDDPVDIIAGRAAPSEPGLTYTADLDATTRPRDDEAEKYESTRPLSDAQLRDLGYLADQT